MGGFSWFYHLPFNKPYNIIEGCKSELDMVFNGLIFLLLHNCLSLALKNDPDFSVITSRGRQLWTSMKSPLCNIRLTNYGEFIIGFVNLFKEMLLGSIICTGNVSL